jgi:hypothetical protein
LLVLNFCPARRGADGLGVELDGLAKGMLLEFGVTLVLDVAAQVEFESQKLKAVHHTLLSSAQFQAVSTWVS